MNKIRIFIACTLALCVIAPDAAGAEGNIHFGKLKIHPYVSVNETWTDNIYSTSTEARRDSLTTTAGGVRLQYPFRMHNASLEYGAIMVRHHTYNGEDTTGQNASGAVNLKIGSRASLDLSEKYVKGHEERGASATGFIEVYHSNSTSASAAYKLADRTKLQLDYTYSTDRYDTSPFRDRDAALVSAYFYYRFLPKTSAFIEYDHKDVLYVRQDLGMDSAENGAQLGLTWELTKRSRGTVKCGVMRKTFEDAQAPTLKTWTYSVDMSHELTGRTSVMISGARRVNESSLSGNSYLITTSGGADLSYQFVGKLFGVVRGSYSMDSFANAVPPDTVRRIDRISATGVGLRYAFKDWLGFTLDYTTSTRRSNLSQNDYVAHTTTVAVNMSF